MTKRTILIILGALLLLLVIALAWWWFFSWSAEQPGPTEGFGSGQERPGAGAGGGGQTNIGSGVGGGGNDPAGSAVDLGVVGPLGGGGSGGSRGPGGGGQDSSGNSTDGSIVVGTPGTSTVITPTFTPSGTSTIDGVTWLPGGGPVTSFTPTPTNDLDDGTIGGQVVLFGTPPNPQNTTDLSTALVGVGIGTALCTAGLLGPNGALGTTAGAVAIAKLQTAVGAPGVLSADLGLRQQNVLTGAAQVNSSLNASSDSIRENFLNCITRTIARAAVQQITASTINWINSGFNGKPSFIQNYQQFFTNVADQAAGAYIQGSALSFLCSPFGNKVRIALAQNYANRGAASCTLSRVSSNIQGFMNGNFGAGGWAGLLQFTTTPTNNPFGAYSYAQAGLANAQAQAQQNAQRRISPGGFLSSQEERNCILTDRPQYSSRKSVRPEPTRAGMYRVCDIAITTPGSTIEASLANTLNVSQSTLTQAGISGSFDAIISALIQQLSLRALQGGVSNLSGTQGYENNFLTDDQRLAQSQGNATLAELQKLSAAATKYGEASQGAVADVQSAQAQLQELANCWETHATDQNRSSAQRAQAAANASSTLAAQAQLEPRVSFFNGRITRANAAIALLQAFQSRVLQVASQVQVAAITADLRKAEADGALLAAEDVTTAQQDRTTLQGELSARNKQTAAELIQCKSF